MSCILLFQFELFENIPLTETEDDEGSFYSVIFQNYSNELYYWQITYERKEEMNEGTKKNTHATIQDRVCVSKKRKSMSVSIKKEICLDSITNEKRSEEGAETRYRPWRRIERARENRRWRDYGIERRRSIVDRFIILTIFFCDVRRRIIGGDQRKADQDE